MAQSSASQTLPTAQFDGLKGSHARTTDPSGQGHYIKDATQQREETDPTKQSRRRLLASLAWFLLSVGALACAIRVSIVATRRQRIHLAEAFFWFAVQFSSNFFPLARFVLIGVRVTERHLSERRIVFLQTLAILGLMVGLGVPLAWLWWEKSVSSS